MASEQYQLNMSENELPNPGNMEGLAEMASTSLPTSQMTNTSMPNQSDPTQNCQLNDLRLLSGEGMHLRETNQSQFRQGYQIQVVVDEMNSLQYSSGAGMHFQQTNQPQFQQGYLDGVDEMNSLQFSSGAGMHLQQTNQPQFSQSNQIQGGLNQMNSLHYSSGAGMHFQQTNQPQFSQSNQIQGGVDKMNSLQYSSGAGIHFQQANQPQFTQSYQILGETDTSCGMVNFQQTSQQAYQRQIDQSNSLPSTSGGARHPQRPHLTQTSQSQTDQLKFLQSTSGGVVYSQQTNQHQLSEACQSRNQLNSLQPTSGGVRNSPQSELNRARQSQSQSQSQTDQLNSPQYTSGTGMQLTQGEPSHGSPQPNSRRGDTLSDVQNQKLKSVISSEEYRESQKNKMPTSQKAYQSPINQSNSQPSTSGGARHSQQPQLTKTAQCQTAEMNVLHSATGGMMHSQRTSQPQLTHGEQSQNTKSRSDNTLAGDKKERTRSAIYSENYRVKKKKEEEKKSDRIKHLEAKVRELENRQIHPQSFSALASFPRDHHHNGTNSVESDQEKISYDDVRKLKRRKQLWSAVHHLLQKESTSRQQPNEPLSEQARQSTIEQLNCSKDYHEIGTEAPDQFNGSQISNDVEDPQRKVSSSSRGAASSAHCTKNKKNSQARGEKTKRGPEGRLNIYDWIKPVNRGRTSDGERQTQCDQGLSATPSPSTDVTVPKSITLSVELLETDSAFDSASVAHKISTSLLPPADKKRMDSPFSVNPHCGTHYAWLNLVHALKAEKHIKQIECERNEYHEKAKKAKLEAQGLQQEVKRLEGELAEAEIRKDEAVHAALANFQKTAEFTAAVKQASEIGVQDAFNLCINEVQHIYPNWDLSMISIDKLRTIGDDPDCSDDSNGEGDNTSC